MKDGISIRSFFKKSVPTVLQIETAECGLACIVSALKYFGVKIDMAQARRAQSSSLRGTSVAALTRLAARFGMHSRVLKVGMSKVSELKTPTILHWGLNHFVVLESFQPTKAIIMDPAQGRREIEIEEFSDYFTGIAIEFRLSEDAESKLVATDTSFVYKHLFRGLKKNIIHIYKILAVSLVLEFILLLLPLYIKTIMDTVLPKHDVGLLNTLVLAFVIIVIFRFVAGLARNWSVANLSAKMNLQWAQETFAHMLRLPMLWFDQRSVGDIVSRYTSIKRIQEIVGPQFIGAILDGFMAFLSLVALYFLSATAFIAAATSMVIYSVVRILFRSHLLTSNREYISSYAKQYGFLVETVRAALPIKLNNLNEIRSSSFLNTLVDTTNRELRFEYSNTTLNFLRDLLVDICRIVAIWLGASQVLSGNLSVGGLIASITYAELFLSRSTALVDKFSEIDTLRAHIERVQDIALTSHEEINGTRLLSNRGASIEFNNVSFTYDTNEQPLIDNISFAIQQGESVAITGPSGSGKTTLAKLILGLAKPTHGEIRLNGQSLDTLDKEDYRQVVGAVMQNDQLLAGTLAENISFFQDGAAFEDVVAAACLANIHSDIISMPMGYYTYVGDMGSTLSGGQKQRIILARALFKKPILLLLDEATSHLDVGLERSVSEAIKDLKITRIIIAHRLETINSADRVYELTKGQLKLIN